MEGSAGAKAAHTCVLRARTSWVNAAARWGDGPAEPDPSNVSAFRFISQPSLCRGEEGSESVSRGGGGEGGGARRDRCAAAKF
jgi:hypothetical protein